MSRLVPIYILILCGCVDAVRVPSSWKELPYHTVVDGLPTNEETYYPPGNSAISDQIVQNDEVIKLFQELNPTIKILHPETTQNLEKSHEEETTDNAVKHPSNQGYYHYLQNKDTPKQKYNEQYPENPGYFSYLVQNPVPPFRNSESHLYNADITVNSNDKEQEKHEKSSSNEVVSPTSKINKNKKSKKKSSKQENVAPDPYLDKQYVSYHENPGEIPTKPLYPGEGQWVRKGLKHQPHISRHRFSQPIKEEESNPGLDFFTEQKGKFEKDYEEFPRKYNLESPKKENEDRDEVSPNEFIPYRTYAQVRQTNTKKKSKRPRKEDPRLRETINDSKVHTVYTEEGYEDAAYDHGDQEKNAESTEGSVKRNRKTGTQNTESESDPEEKKNNFEFPQEPEPPEEDENNESEEENEEAGGEANEEKEGKESEMREETNTNSDQAEKPLVNEKPESKIAGNSSDAITPDEEESQQNNKELESKESHKNSESVNKLLKEIINKANSESIIVDKNENNDSENDETEPDYSDDIIIRFGSPEPPLDEVNEERLIDNVMEEAQFGTKLKTASRFRRSIHSQSKITSTESPMNKKYPYYNSEEIDALSTLRYAENLKNIAHKIKGKMSFYDKADELECPEMESEDTLPDEIKDSQNNTEKANETTTNPPKLNKLGDQIDCLKARYFGENPFDNPLFQEESIESPRSIFRKQYNNSQNVEATKYYDKSENITRSGKQLSDNSTEESLPDALPYFARRVFVKVPNKNNNVYTTKGVQLRKFQRQSTKPQRMPERISEVHYKEDIKPSEQMNVFADVINNIKNLSRDSDTDGSENEPVAIRVNIMRPKHNSRYKHRTTTMLPIEIEGVKEMINRYKSLRKNKNNLNSGNYDDIPNANLKKLKRKRRPQIQTPNEIEVSEPVAEYSNARKRKIRPDYDNEIQTANQEYEFKPVWEEDLIQTNHKPNYHDVEPSTMNKFYVVGMRPPPEKPYNHPNYRSNQIKKRTYPIRRRVVRSTRKGYAAIRRGESTEKPRKEEEEDDYVPHRPKNFYYDVDTGKIIYDKNTKTEEEEDFEYIEVEEPEPATHPPPKKKEPARIWPKKFPDGLNYLDIIKKLKENTNYVEILDPKSTEKPDKTTATATLTSKPAPTGIPEFLSILNKVHSDKTYKLIEDTTLKSKKTTTPQPIEGLIEYEAETSEDIKREDTQNSPGLQSVLGKNLQLQIFDISEFIPKIKNYNPKTSIDTSKYTSIQRNPSTRHKISSKYNSDDSNEADDSEETEPIPTTTTESFTIDIPTTSIPATIPIRSTTPLTKTRRILASRRRGTTISTTEATAKAASVRIQRGRSRFRSLSTTTTAETPKTESTSRNRRNLQRRNYNNLTVPRNHKPQYTNTKAVSEVKPTPRSITLSIINQISVPKPTNVTNRINDSVPSENGNDTKINDVDVFKKIDKNQKHGGNYKYKKVEIKITRNFKPYSKENEELENEATEKLSDVSKPYDYYSDTKLPTHINHLKEKNVDFSESDFDEDEESSKEKYEISSKEREEFYDDIDLKSEKKKGKDTPVFVKDPSQRLYYYAPV